MASKINTSSGALFIETCYRCKTVFAMSENVYRLALERRGQVEFFCPNGHGQVYVKGETEEEKLRREVDRLRQRVAQRDDAVREERERADLERRRAAAAPRSASHHRAPAR